MEHLGSHQGHNQHCTAKEIQHEWLAGSKSQPDTLGKDREVVREATGSAITAWTWTDFTHTHAHTLRLARDRTELFFLTPQLTPNRRDHSDTRYYGSEHSGELKAIFLNLDKPNKQVKEQKQEFNCEVTKRKMLKNNLQEIAKKWTWYSVAWYVSFNHTWSLCLLVTEAFRRSSRSSCLQVCLCCSDWFLFPRFSELQMFLKLFLLSRIYPSRFLGYNDNESCICT